MTNALLPVAAITEETLNLAKSAFMSPIRTGPGLSKAGINLAENLVGINLEAPSKKLFPVYAPLRNRFARIKAPIGATAVTWRSIKKINSNNVWPGVAENTRNLFVTTQTETLTATFKTLGLDDFVGFEALAASKAFEDIRATAALNLLYATMIQEEKVILGGNATAVGAPVGVAGTAIATPAGSVDFGAGTYTFKVSALVLRGSDKLAQGIVAGVDSDGESTPSAASAAVVVAGAQVVSLTWTDKKPAVAYNVFAKIAADPTFTFQGTVDSSGTVTVNKWISTLAYTNTGNVPNAADQTGSSTEFDGVIPFIANNVTGSQFQSLNATTLTSDGAGGITQFDTALKSMWDAFRLGPTVILVNSEQARDITKKIGSSSNLAYRVYLQDGQRNIVGGIYVGSYLNKFASSFAEGFQNEVPIKIHPYLPAGTILFVTEVLPYPNNMVPNVFEIETNQEYTQYEWALSQRRYEFGIYVIEVLKSYYSVAHAIIKNVSPG